MGTWYTIGLAAGLGVAVGVLLAGALGAARTAAAVAATAAAVAGATLGLALFEWPEAAAGAAGGGLGAAGAAQLVGGTLRRGGTRAGVAFLLALAAVLLAALALVPVLGYLEAVAVPALAARLRRRAGQTYAGLRVLARD